MSFLLLMPSFNQASYIADAVRSVLAQDDPDWQLWVLDNSTDSTPEVMNQFTDPRIHFHHIPERMDPGSCLNWMLANASGEHFSYLHTDNNLEPCYVRLFRKAMQGHDLALAYCDMYVIDAQGKRTEVFQRGAFDLPRLLSLDTLGVPFAATTRLASRLGGFSVEDVADDVRFCISAYGLAEFIYLRVPMIEYRLHGGSRTAAAGGASGMRNALLRALPKALTTLEHRGLQPRQQIAATIDQRLADFEDLARRLWHDRLGRLPVRWLGPIDLDQLLHEPGTADRRWANPIRHALVRRFLGRNRELRHFARRILPLLLPWAHLSLEVPAGARASFRIRNLDLRTVWVAGLLQAELGWTPSIDSVISAPPRWLRWEQADGNEPLLDCNHGVRLG